MAHWLPKPLTGRCQGAKLPTARSYRQCRLQSWSWQYRGSTKGRFWHNSVVPTAAPRPNYVAYWIVPGGLPAVKVKLLCPLPAAHIHTAGTAQQTPRAAPAIVG
jgi:hypothetical protein